MMTPGGSTAPTADSDIESQRRQYYAELENLQMNPLWDVLRRQPLGSLGC